MISKVSADMYPVNELRKAYEHRIRTTGFFNTDPSIIVSFKLFSNVVAYFDGASDIYSDIIENATNNLSFFTEAGWFTLQEVEYMFIDKDDYCVAVLKNGNDLIMRTPPKDNESNPIKIDSPLKLTVSTEDLKNYYLSHFNDFRFLNRFSKELDSHLESRSQFTKNFKSIAELIRTGEIFFPWQHVMHDLKKLFAKSSFELNVGRTKKSSSSSNDFKDIINNYL